MKGGSGRDITDPLASVRGEALFRRLENLFLRADRLIEKFLPPSLNPLARTGAVANTCFLIAAATGVLLLFWYSPSLTGAYRSLDESSFLGRLFRSMHRYSSDGCVFFMVLHVGRVLSARRFLGPRALAWVAGVGLALLIWILGWTGYWLVWDVRAQEVALFTARLMDVVPVFPEPLSRAFLTNQGVPSLLFFLVFFAHMLLPLAVGVLLWIHLSRLSRPRLLTGRLMTSWIIGVTVLLSLIAPARSAPPADLGMQAGSFALDGWFLWPLVVGKRLAGGTIWALSLLVLTAVTTVPWWMRRGTPGGGGRKPVGAAIGDWDACGGRTPCSTERKSKPGREIDPRKNRWLRIAGGFLLATILAALTWLPSVLPHTGSTNKPEWIVSFKLGGERVEDGKRLTTEEFERLPVHMRGELPIAGRRFPVRMRIAIDGETALERTYRPGGLRRDGASTGLERLRVDPGEYELRVQIGSTGDRNEWSYEWSGRLVLEEGVRRVLLFDAAHGFVLH
jgi:hypothetical protein